MVYQWWQSSDDFCCKEFVALEYGESVLWTCNLLQSYYTAPVKSYPMELLWVAWDHLFNPCYLRVYSCCACGVLKLHGREDQLDVDLSP